ncbi:MAG: hypothetical protein L3K02_09195 [Thermoplasmata archaeon]|nr:hypothetical protein [Thermoplasmata archaeon]
MGITTLRTSRSISNSTVGGWGLKGATCGIVGVALLLLLSPAAQATSAGPAHITIKAPYTGSTGYRSSSSSSAGCGSGTIVRAPFFHPKAGGVGFSVRAHASACPPSYGDSGGASASELVTVPIPATTGNNIVHAKWSIDASLRSTIGAATCLLTNASYSDCYSTGYANLYGYAYLVDMTNGTYYVPDNYWAGAYAESSFYAYCYAGNCSSAVTGNAHVALASSFDWTFHAHGLVASHSYVLEFSWYADAYAYDYTYLATLTGASESAAVAMAGPGLGATLESITVR